MNVELVRLLITAGAEIEKAEEVIVNYIRFSDIIFGFNIVNELTEWMDPSYSCLFLWSPRDSVSSDREWR